MLPDATLPASLLAVLQHLRWVFTALSFATFAALAAGLIANTGVGTVKGCSPAQGCPAPGRTTARTSSSPAPPGVPTRWACTRPG